MDQAEPYPTTLRRRINELRGGYRREEREELGRSWIRPFPNGTGQEACPTLAAGLFFRGGEVAYDEVLLDLVDHELVRLPRLGGVELDRLVDVLIPFFGQLVVGHDFDGVPVFLRVDALQLQSDIADTLRHLGLAELELGVGALAEAFERLQFLGVGGDEAALHAEIAARAVKVGDGLLE